MSVLVALVHNLTPAQIEELSKLGKVELLKDVKPGLFDQLSNCPGVASELEILASNFLAVTDNYRHVVLPIGSPAFNAILNVMGGENFKNKCLYAHSERKSVEKINEDGTVQKQTIFEHQYFFNI